MTTFVDDVRLKASGHWEAILQRLDIPTNRGEGECPHCGGETRYRFDDKEGRGTYFCSHCGSGTGLDLVMKVNQCGAREAAVLVAGAMALPLPDTVPFREKSPLHIVDKVTALLKRTHTGESVYLSNKGLHSPHLLLEDGSLLLVLRTMTGNVTGAQVVSRDGSKRLLSGTRKKEAFIPVGDVPEETSTVLITEGYATALTVQQIRPDAFTVAAVDSGNLKSVAEVMTRRYPAAQIIIAADNDIRPGERNTGKEEAEKAAVSVSGQVALPPTDHQADWDDYRQQHGTEAAVTAFAASLYQPEGNCMKIKLTAIEGGNKSKRHKTTWIDIQQMAANQRAEILAERYGNLVVNPESEKVFQYNSGIWELVPDSHLQRTMAKILDEHGATYGDKGIKGAIAAMKLQLPEIGSQPAELIGFSNGVYNLATREFHPHSLNNWLMNHNGIAFTPPSPGENLKDHAPCFHKWITHAVAHDPQKAERIKAALFMVLANRYDWQMFIEVTGEGGSGKSVFTAIATLLAGEHNSASSNMKALDEARGRAQFVGKRLITLPDQPRYAGEGTGIKAITGGDRVEIDGKYEKQFSIVLQAVVLATNNEPMTFTERNGGIARRRVIFPFNIPVKDADKDPDLVEKIRHEIPVVIRHLLTVFADPNKAKQLLTEQRGSAEAREVKRGTDPVIDLCAALYFMEEPGGLMMGGGTYAGQPEPKKYLYHLYLAFLEYHGLGKPLAVNRFSKAMKNAAKEYQKEYLTRLIRGRTQTNVDLNDYAEEFLPRAFGVEIPK